MSYIEDNLMAGERVIYRTTITKAVFLWPTLLLLMGLKVWLIFLVGSASRCTSTWRTHHRNLP